MVEISANISLTDYVKVKIGPEAGRGHDGYYDTLLSVAGKVTTSEQAEDVKDSIDAIASAVKMEGTYSLRGQSGQRFTVEHPSRLINALLKLSPYLGKGLDVEGVIKQIEMDLRKIGR